MGNFDEELLARMEKGLLLVNEATLEVKNYHKGRRNFMVKKPDQHPKSGRWRFRFGPRRCTVYRNRLLWMWKNRILVPEGYVVDHIDGNLENDNPSNLRLMLSEESNAQGGQSSEEAALERLSLWFMRKVPF